MPLVIFCGFPSSGKTTKCIALRNQLEDIYKVTVKLITDHDQNINKNIAYKGTVKVSHFLLSMMVA